MNFVILTAVIFCY